MAKTVFENGNPSQATQGTVVTAEFLNATNNHRHTGQDIDGAGALDYAADSGAANAYIIALSPALTAQIIGMPVCFKAATANTGISTLKINDLTALTVKKNGSSDLNAGDILAGQLVCVAYDGTYFQLISPPVPDTAFEIIKNLKLVRNAAVNKIDIFARSNGAAPDALNPIRVPIPDGNGSVVRARAAQYLSGTSQIILADGYEPWGRSSLPQSQYWACLYAIWDGTGIIWAAAGNPYLRNVSTNANLGAQDFMLLEAGTTYTRNASHFCQMVGIFEYEYDTADTPDHTLESAGFMVCVVPPKYVADVGETSIHWREIAPIGELELHGQSLLRSDYRRLFSYFGGPIYGNADSTHFYLPNPDGFFLRIWDHARGYDPDAATRTDRGDGQTGDHVGTRQPDGVISHTHVIPNGSSGSAMGVTAVSNKNNDPWQTDATGGSETRGKNINIMLTIKY